MVERGTKPNSSMMRSLRRASCRCRLSSAAIVSGLHELVDQGRGGGEAYGHSLLADGQAQTQGHVGLAGATVADGDDIPPLCSMYSHRASSMTSCLFTEGMARKSKVSRLLTAGKRGGPDPALHHALVSVNEFQFGETQQVVRVVHILGGALGGQLAVLPEEGGEAVVPSGGVPGAAWTGCSCRPLRQEGQGSPWRWWSSR